MTPIEAATREAFPNHFHDKPKRPRADRRGTGKRKAVINYDQVRQLTEQGRTCTQIAATLGCSRSAVHNIRQRLGITTNYNKPLTPERRQLIEQAIADGWSQAEICRTHHVDPETMRRHYPDAKWGREQQNEYIRTLRIGRNWNWNSQGLAA